MCIGAWAPAPIPTPQGVNNGTTKDSVLDRIPTRQKPILPDPLLVTVLAQALFALVRGHLVSLPLLTARHVFYCFSFVLPAMIASAAACAAGSVTIVLYFITASLAIIVLSTAA